MKSVYERVVNVCVVKFGNAQRYSNGITHCAIAVSNFSTWSKLLLSAVTFYHSHGKGSWGLVSSIISLSIYFSYSSRPNAFIFVLSSNIRRPLAAGAFANNLTSHFLRLPAMCKREMAEKQVQKNRLPLGDRVKPIVTAITY